MSTPQKDDQLLQAANFKSCPQWGWGSFMTRCTSGKTCYTMSTQGGWSGWLHLMILATTSWFPLSWTEQKPMVFTARVCSCNATPSFCVPRWQAFCFFNCFARQFITWKKSSPRSVLCARFSMIRSNFDNMSVNSCLLEASRYFQKSLLSMYHPDGGYFSSWMQHSSYM